MDEKVIKFQGKTLKSQAKTVIYDDSEIINKEVTAIKIKKEDIEFWNKFLLDWTSALDIMYKHEKELFEQGQFNAEDYDFNKRTYDLGLTTLAILFDQLREWKDTEDSNFIYRMNAMDCYFIPAYLDDYKAVNKLTADKCDLYVQVILHALSLNGNLDERLDTIEALVDEYIETREPIYFE